MTQKEKAKELINRFYISFPLDDFNKERYIFVKKHAKNCALVAVNEILECTIYYFNDNDNFVTYWQEVKKEIELM